MDNTSTFQDQFLHKKVIVAGGAGFIGSHLCEALLIAGAEVIAVDNFVTGQKNNVSHLLTNSQFQLIDGDVIQAPTTYLPADFIPDFLFHFASPASPVGYQAKPVETYLVNSYGTHQLLQYLLHANPKAQFFYASTSEVYGDPLEHPQKESYWGNVNPNGLRSCYDESKRLGETICGVHQRNFGMDVRIIRIFNTYGPRIDLNEGRIIPSLIRAALAHQPFTIFGDGHQTRSYCYVSDLIDGILRFSTAPNLSGQTINLGNPGEFTVLDTVKVFEEVLQEKIAVESRPLPADDPTRRRPDITKAQQLLDWTPQVDFKTGLAKTIASFR